MLWLGMLPTVLSTSWTSTSEPRLTGRLLAPLLCRGCQPTYTNLLLHVALSAHHFPPTGVTTVRHCSQATSVHICIHTRLLYIIYINLYTYTMYTSHRVCAALKWSHVGVATVPPCWLWHSWHTRQQSRVEQFYRPPLGHAHWHRSRTRCWCHFLLLWRSSLPSNMYWLCNLWP